MVWGGLKIAAINGAALVAVGDIHSGRCVAGGRWALFAHTGGQGTEAPFASPTMTPSGRTRPRAPAAVGLGQMSDMRQALEVRGQIPTNAGAQSRVLQLHFDVQGVESREQPEVAVTGNISRLDRLQRGAED